MRLTNRRPNFNHTRIGQGTSVDYLPKKQACIFIKLFNEIKEKVGSQNQAIKIIGIGFNPFYLMINEKKLSTNIAKKILDAHTKLFKKPNHK